MKPPSGTPAQNPHDLYIPEGTIITDTLLHILKYKKLNQVYSSLHDKDPLLLINSLLDELELKYDLPEQDLRNIPDEGGFITISNHPYRGIDSCCFRRPHGRKRFQNNGQLPFKILNLLI
jgi:hypothetical protein